LLTVPSFFIQQATFCVNSLAHWLGDQPFDDRNSPRDHVITALVTLGEGYHKYVPHIEASNTCMEPAN
jgi:stearoyl-CoA desaturase (delta-9 desaturase)